MSLPRSGRLYDMFLRKIPQQSRSRSVVEAILTAAIERVSRASEDEEVVLEHESNLFEASQTEIVSDGTLPVPEPPPLPP